MRRMRFPILTAALLSCPAMAAHAANAGYLTTGACPADAAGTHLQLTVGGLHSAKGRVTVVIYGDKASDFLEKGKKLVKVHLDARAGAITGCIRLPKPGVYALAAYHDEDDDHHLSRNFIGIPTEGYAFSNNPDTFFGLPSFRSVRFRVGAGVTDMTVSVHYP